MGGIAIECEEIPAAIAGVFVDEMPAGKVTSAVMSPALGRVLALAIVKKELLTPATGVSVAYGEGKRQGQVVSFPLCPS